MIKEATIDDLKQVVKIVMKYRDFYGVDEQSVADVEKFMKSSSRRSLLPHLKMMK